MVPKPILHHFCLLSKIQFYSPAPPRGSTVYPSPHLTFEQNEFSVSPYYYLSKMNSVFHLFILAKWIQCYTLLFEQNECSVSFNDFSLIKAYCLQQCEKINSVLHLMICKKWMKGCIKRLEQNEWKKFWRLKDGKMFWNKIQLFGMKFFCAQKQSSSK